MSTATRTAREYLRKRYAHHLPPGFQDFSASIEPGGNSPAWVWVDARLQPSPTTFGGLLLDEEIGTCLCILPYTPDARITEQIERALCVRDSLEPSREHGDRIDRSGFAWNVAVHWLVEERDFESWNRKIVQIRAVTDHFEAVPMDAVLNCHDDWDAACGDHGFPRLLLTTRKVLSLQDPEEIAGWSSAEALVQRLVRSLPESCAPGRERDRAAEVVAHLDSQLTPESPGMASPGRTAARPLSGLAIRRFRNLDDVTFAFGPEETASAAVIQGPNGTGKSNVFEALSLRLCGSSHRYLRFLSDRDVVGTARGRRYLEEYLRPLHSPEGDPAVALNEEAGEPITLMEEESARAVLEKYNGTLLSQEETSAFLEMSGAELGGRVVGDSSRLVDSLMAFIREHLEAARNAQKTFFRRWDLSPSIRKQVTARDRIGRRILQETLILPTDVLVWLEDDSIAAIPPLSEARTLAARWRSMYENLPLLAVRVAETDGEADRLNALASTLHAGGEIASDTRRLLERYRARAATLPDGTAEALRHWGNWLSSVSSGATSDRAALDTLKRTGASLETEQQRVLAAGRGLRARLDHLDRVTVLLETETGNTTCPTCGTDLEGRGGVDAALHSERSRVEREIKACRARYRDVTEKLKAIEVKLNALGVCSCPLDASRQAAVLDAVAWLLPEGVDARVFLRDPKSRETLCNVVRHLAAIPEFTDWPAGTDSRNILSTLAASISEAFDQVEKVSADVNAWQALERRLSEQLATLVGDILPQTVQAIWTEIAWNLTPAPWQFRIRPTFSLGTTRHKPSALVALERSGKTRLARFLLNEAEVRTLGLAWFFTRYFLAGRFQNAFLVLDDPAAQMDDTTFQDFCRFEAMLVRLHRNRKLPLTVVTLLGNGARARVAAKMTSGILHRLYGARTKSAE